METYQLKKNTLISTASLFFQSGYSAFLGLIANLVLTIVLSPAVFGIYITVLSFISIFNYFSDIGLAASLVQKPTINDNDLKTAFTVQQLLIISLITIGLLSGNMIINFYHLNLDGLHLYWALLVAFFFSSLKTIPSVLLERKIQFQKIVAVQITENTLFYILVTVFAIFGFALKSFTYAVLIRSLVGVIMIYVISFWRPKLGISFSSLKQLLSFGLPFQTNSLLALVKDDLIILYLGKVLGFERLGYIGWAKKWAEAPIRIIMDNLSRVMFPLFSRFQDNREKLARLIEKIFYFQTAAILPTILGAALVMDQFVQIVPKYAKWQPALPLFYLFCLSAFLATFSTPLINFFNAIGKVRISFGFMVFWTGLTWILTPLFTRLFGAYGLPLTLLILSSMFVFVVLQAKRLISFRFIKPITPFIVSGSIMFLPLLFLKTLNLLPITYLFIAVTSGIIIYYASLNLIFQINLISDIKSLFRYE